MPETASSIVYWQEAFSCTAVRKRRHTWNHRGMIDSDNVGVMGTHEPTSEQVTVAKVRQYLDEDLDREEVEYHGVEARVRKRVAIVLSDHVIRWALHHERPISRSHPRPCRLAPGRRRLQRYSSALYTVLTLTRVQFYQEDIVRRIASPIVHGVVLVTNGALRLRSISHPFSALLA